MASNHAAAFNLNRAMKPNQIRNSELLQNGNRISCQQSWRALKQIEIQVFDDEAESFKKISSFLQKADPQAYWRLKTQNHHSFKLFIASGPTRETLCWCRYLWL